MYGLVARLFVIVPNACAFVWLDEPRRIVRHSYQSLLSLKYCDNRLQ